MTSEQKFYIDTINPNFKVDIQQDKYTEDHQLKYKLRSLNLIKHNPNLFTNREGLFELMGGYRTLITTLLFGGAFAFYRHRANLLRGISAREGIWFTNVYFLFGSSIGLLYSSAFFLQWQILLNDYYSQFLFKRYKGSNGQSRKNIYQLRNVLNEDECYQFSANYANSYHM